MPRLKILKTFVGISFFRVRNPSATYLLFLNTEIDRLLLIDCWRPVFICLPLVYNKFIFFLPFLHIFAPYVSQSLFFISN